MIKKGGRKVERMEEVELIREGGRIRNNKGGRVRNDKGGRVRNDKGGTEGVRKEGRREREGTIK